MDGKREIIKQINEISGSRSPYEVFCDWVKCMALSISNSCCLIHGPIWKAREETYLKTMQRYDKNDQGKFARMTALLIDEMEKGPRDLLGEIYMESGWGNKNTGQFFTPFHVSLAAAELTIGKKEDDEKIRLSEPSCGAGGMILAAAETLRKQGKNYQKLLDVVAQDLDWKAVYMCYVHLSLYGISAIVVQGNTLSDPWTGSHYPPKQVFYTPRRVGLLI